MKVSLLLNTHNEGPDVRATIRSFRAAAGDCEVEAIVFADGTTDNSAKDLGDEALVLYCPERAGIGKAKDVLCQHATGDVFWHNDAHNRLVQGTCQQVASQALSHDGPCIITPRVAPLRCANQDRCGHYGDKKVCQITCKKHQDALDVPNRGHYGGDMKLDSGKQEELKIDAIGRPPVDAISQVQGVNFSTFAFTRETLEALGGWNRFPGWWGSQELGLSLRAWFSGIPIILMRDVVVLHRFRSWNRPDGSPILGREDLAYYDSKEGHRTANSMYSLRAVFSDETWDAWWKPWYDRKGDAAAQDVFDKSEITAQQHQFQVTANPGQCLARTRATGKQCQHKPLPGKPLCASHNRAKNVQLVQPLKKRTDREFFSEVLRRPYPLDWKIADGASRALYCLRAGMGDVLMSIPAQKALADMAGDQIDIWERGLHQGDDMAALLEAQPWVRKVIRKDEPVDLTFYPLVASEYWAKGPGFVPMGAKIGEPGRKWRVQHEVEANMQAVRQLGYDGPTPAATLGTWQTIEGLELPPDYVVIGPGGRSHDRKEYPHWRQVAEHLRARGVPVVFIGEAKHDQPWMDTLGTSLCGKTTLLQLAGVLWKAALYLGIDNGPSHLAAAMRIPSVLLYGPTAERKNQPWGPVTILRADEYDCAPCYEHPRQGQCRIVDKAGKAHDVGPCMRAIQPEYVAAEAVKVLDGQVWQGAEGQRQRFFSVKQRLVNRGGHLAQRYSEMRHLLDLLGQYQITRMIEIGSWSLAWPYLVAETLRRPMDILAIEPEPKDSWQSNVEALEAGGHRLTHLAGKSRDVVAQAVEWTDANGAADLLHIDGDHGIVACTEDWRLYGPLLRPGGLVVFHDILGFEGPDKRLAQGPGQLFEALASRHQAWSFRSPDPMRSKSGGEVPGGGIGVIRLAGSDGTRR